jgi:ATP-dependent helicase/nuclease subunit A
VLDSPQGLEIRTIHAAAQALLAAFPLEAGLPPRADPLDERSAAMLRRRALADALSADGLAADLERLAVEAGENAIHGKLGEQVRAGRAYARIGGPEHVEPFLRRLVELPLGPTPAALMEAAVTGPAFDDAAVEAFRDVVGVAGRKDAARALACIDGWPGWSPAERVAAIPEITNLVLDSSGKRRGTTNIGKRLAGGEQIFDRLHDAVMEVVERQRALAFVDHAGAWLRLGMAVSDRYQALKRAAAAVDFDDMVALAADLIAEEGMANAIAERLDRRILHVLVDEAQDTNEAQWRLIEGLAAEFDAGLGQHDAARRTRFVVGDFKQAIFRFQGTDPQLFLAVRQRWRTMTAAAGREQRQVGLDRNFRASGLLLRLVDAVLGELGAAALGLPPGELLPPHKPDRADLPARVLLLPPHEVAVAVEETAEAEAAEAADPEFAKRLARGIAALVRPGSPERAVLTDRQGRHYLAGPGDVLVLLQARGDLMSELVRALHACGVPVAGVDRARLAEPLAVRDLLSLVRFVAQPADDLALAEVMTSPLGGLDHEALRRLREDGRTLWQSLLASADPAHAEVTGRLRDVLRMADQAGPHGFLQAVLARGGRAAFRARLGPEADDGIDALLSHALAFESDNPPTLQGFLAHVAASDEPLGRDPDSTPGLVRLMTVHRAKGLEAPIVVLADALRPRPRTQGAVSWTSPDGRDSLPLVFGNVDRKPRAIAALWAAADTAEAAEHNRLLYVALTRAQQILIVAGQISERRAAARAKPDAVLDTWHDRVGQAMDALGAVDAADGAFGDTRLLAEGDWPVPGPDCARAEASPLPAWSRAVPAPEPRSLRPFIPSAPLPDEPPLPPPGPAQKTAAARGVLLHRMFEHLPDVPPARRADVAFRMALAAGHAEGEARALAETALAVLDAPALSGLFSGAALVEAPVAGEVEGRLISGTIDRLLVGDDRLLLLDYKTGHQLPATAAEVPTAYWRQMAAYRALLAAAFPGRAVTAALVYTAGPKLIYLDDKQLAAHWPPAEA